MASFGQLSVEILIKPFPNTHTPQTDLVPDGFIRTPFCPDLLPKAIADLLPDGFIWTPFCPDLDQAIFEPKYTFPNRTTEYIRIA